MTKPTIAILGAGKLGTVLAQLAVRAGYPVYIAGSGPVSKIELTVKVITPGAIAATASQAVAASDIVILALPLSKFETINADSLAGKLVIDAMNYWWEVDGDMPQLQAAQSSSQMVADYLESARLVKALSHMGYHHLRDDAQPKSASDRKAIAIAGDNPNDNQLVAQVVDDLGFDPVHIGDLAAGKQLEPGNPLFGTSISAEQLADTLK